MERKLMSPRKLAQLSRAELRKEIIKTIAVCCTFSVAIFTIYFTLPFDSLSWGGQAVTRLVIGLIIFGLVLTIFIRRILRADVPQLRAAETLIVSLVLFLCFYASVYLEISNHTPDTFTKVLNHTSALYFTIVTFGTVGYGDISANTDLARILVSAQIIIDVIFIAALAKLVIFASQFTLKKEADSAQPE